MTSRLHQSTAGTAAIILCGGESRRMGRPKWSLRFGPETMLDRTVRILSGVFDIILIVGPAEGPMPRVNVTHADKTRSARDRLEGRGPLEGMAVGLTRALELGARWAYITTCDAPLVRAEFVQKMLDLASGHDAAVVRTSDGVHPLGAVYASTLVDRLEEALAAGERRAQALAELANTRWVTAEELTDIDPELHSLRNINTPEEYAAALETAGLLPL